MTQPTEEEQREENIRRIDEFIERVKSGRYEKDTREIIRMFDEAIRHRKDNYLLTEIGQTQQSDRENTNK